MKEQIDVSELNKKLDTLIQLLSKPKPQPIFGVSGEEVAVLAPEDVLYVEKKGALLLHMANRKSYRVKLGDEELKKRLGGIFVKASEQYVVNLKKVVRYKNSRWSGLRLYMADGAEIEVVPYCAAQIKQILGL